MLPKEKVSLPIAFAMRLLVPKHDTLRCDRRSTKYHIYRLYLKMNPPQAIYLNSYMTLTYFYLWGNVSYLITFLKTPK